MPQKILRLILLLSCTFTIANGQSPSLFWSQQVGTALGNYAAHSITTDDSGYVYTTGMIENIVDVDPGPAVYNIGGSGRSVFVIKQDKSGTIIWAVATDGNSGLYNNEGLAIKYDNQGHIYITGRFWGSVDFDPGPGISLLQTAQPFISYDIFLWKLSTNGNFVRALSFNGEYYDLGVSLAIDGTGSCYITGRFSGICDFDPGPGVYTLQGLTSYNVFICKLDSAGNFVWAKNLPGTAESYSIDSDPLDNIYIAGFFMGSLDFNPDSSGVYMMNAVNGPNGFILKLDSDGKFIWARSFGDNSHVYAYGLNYSLQENAIYISGTFQDTLDLDPGPGTYNLIADASSNKAIYIVKLDTASNLIWGKGFTGYGSEYADSDITSDIDGNVYLTCAFNGTIDFDPDPAGIFNLTSNNIANRDIYIVKLNKSGHFQWANAFGGNYDDIGRSVAVSPEKEIYVCGTFKSDSITFDGITYSQQPNNGFSGIGFIFRSGDCSARFTLYADSIPHNWIALNASVGVPPVTYLWSWGDSTFSSGATPSHTYNDSGYYDINLTIMDADGCTSTYTDTAVYLYRGNGNTMVTIHVVQQIVTAIISYGNPNQYKVFPNPFNSELNIEIPDFDGEIVYIKMINALGEEVYRQTSEFSTIHLPVSFLDPGIYILEIKKGVTATRFKVMKG